MKRFILLALIGVFLTKNVTSSIIHRNYPSNLKWLFGLNNKLNENKTEIREESRTVCKTQECEKFAKALLDSIDKSVDPCDDFYEYACGKWPEHNSIPEGETSWDLFAKLQKNVQRQIENILDVGIEKDDLLAVKLAKKWYAVCMDTDAMDKQGLDPLINTLMRIGGWPMIMHPDEWDELEYSWKKVDDQYMRLTGRNAFHDLRVSESGWNDSEIQVHIDKPHLPHAAYKLWAGSTNDSEKDESDEDPSDENEQSDEQKDSQEPESEDEEDDDDNDDSNDDDDDDDSDKNDSDDYSNDDDDDNDDDSDYDDDDDNDDDDSDDDDDDDDDDDSDDDDDDDDDSDDSDDDDDDDDDDSDDDDDDDNDDSDDDDDDDDDSDDSDYDDDDDDDDDDSDDSDDSDDDDDDDDNDDEDNEINKQDDKDAKKKATKKKSIKKSHHRKNKKLNYNRKRKSGAQITKKYNQKRNHKHNHKIKRQRVKRRAITTKENGQYASRSKFHVQKNKRNHVRKEHTKWAKKTLSNKKDYTSTTSQDSTEQTSDEVALKAKETYADYVFKIASILAKARGAEVSEEDIKKDVEDMIEFQIKLTEIVMESSDSDEFESTLDGFQEWYDEQNSETDDSSIGWVYKIAELLDEASADFDSDLNLKVLSTEYFEALVSLLDKTSSRTIVNYIHWNFLSNMIRTTTSELRQLYYAWDNFGKDDDEDEKERSIDNKETRSSKCIEEVEMSEILAYEYVRKHFSDNITKTAADMIDDIQKEVEYQIKESDWMDEDTKDFVLSKLVNMKKYIGYPDWYKNSTIVKRYFLGLIIGNSYYENTLSYSRYIRWRNLRKLSEDEDDETWWLSPLIVNAFFAPDENALAISAADFQSPFFAYSRPQAINYGLIGFLMAHEVNHGFDDTGHLYDKNGDFVEWLSAMAQAYGQRANCFVEQFNNYPVHPKSKRKIKNYGNQTISDNIADTMGLYTVYKAYQRRERQCGKPDTILPGLEELTNDQLFFLSFANLWCEAIDPEFYNSALYIWLTKMDEHSTGRLRVIGSVSNLEGFAKAYNCPVGSAMNPERKCNIWK